MSKLVKDPTQLLADWVPPSQRPKPRQAEPAPAPPPADPEPKATRGLAVECAGCGKPGAWVVEQGVVLHDFRIVPERDLRVCRVSQLERKPN